MLIDRELLGSYHVNCRSITRFTGDCTGCISFIARAFASRAKKAANAPTPQNQDFYPVPQDPV